ncbi:MAG: aminodeoxychorismate/anthranilate synthase component II [Proteiniphilum sp.]|jgi:anthranilate synthase component 2|nr:aminodeoxychorismate/anthranilate synthase component II [Proteiniphilum sp.]
MSKILIIDNYDSFTYNLLHAVKSLGCSKVDVIRNDRIDLSAAARYDRIILSPGPGIPEEAGLLLPLIERYAKTKSILGVCLGHQAIGVVFGATLVNVPLVFHGVQTRARITGRDYIFAGLPEEILVGRYHSWIVSDADFPPELEVTARDGNGSIMAMRHRRFDLHGVQFHPESILTPEGIRIIRNFIED